MNTDLPIVSVIIPTYNRKDYVQEAIDSALAQTYPRVEVVVVDDGSTDGTGEVLLARYSNRILYVYQENQGESAARNEAIRRSQGEYIALLDSDDVWLPTKLERQVELMKNDPEVGLVACHAVIIDENGDLARKTPIHPEQTDPTVSLETLLLNSPVNASTILIRKNCLDEVGYFREDIRHGEDWDLTLRIASRYKVGYVCEVLACLRNHSKMQTGSTVVTQQEADRKIGDRIAIIESLFSNLDGNSEKLALLKARTIAKEMTRAAILDYLHGEYVRGAERLSQAVNMDRATWLDGEKIAELVYRQALTLAKVKTKADAVKFLQLTYTRLPVEIAWWNSRFRRVLLGRLYIGFAFEANDQGDRKQVRHYLLKGISFDLSHLKNRGVLSIAAKSFLGSRIAKFGHAIVSS